MMKRQKMHRCDSITGLQMKRALTRVLIRGSRCFIIAPETRPAHFRPAPFSPPRQTHQVPTHFLARKAKSSHSCYCLNTASDAQPTNAQHTRRTKAIPPGVGGSSNERRLIIWIEKAEDHQHITAAHKSWQGDGVLGLHYPARSSSQVDTYKVRKFATPHSRGPLCATLKKN